MKKAFVIGISGGSACGKSTFCDMLAKSVAELNVHVIHMDNYFKEINRRPYSAAPITGVMYVDDNHPGTMDLPKARADLNKAVKSGSYDVVIIEGILVLWDKKIYSALDLKLFIDCRPDERIVRRLKRNMSWGLTFDQVANVYLDMVRYRHDEYVEPTKWRADIILNGSMPSEQALLTISEFVKGRVKC